MRHSFLLLNLRHSWQGIRHPWQPAFIETHLPLEWFKNNLESHEMSGQPSASVCAATSTSLPYSARRRGAPGHPSRVPHGPVGSTWKYRSTTSKGFQFCHTKPTKAQNDTVLNNCCVILFKAEVLSLPLLSRWSNLSLLSAEGTSQESPQGRDCGDYISWLMSIWEKVVQGREKEVAATLLVKYQSFDQS